jgi:hypothetical protein
VQGGGDAHGAGSCVGSLPGRRRAGVMAGGGGSETALSLVPLTLTSRSR